MSTEAGSHVAPGSLPVEACTTSVKILFVTRGKPSCCLLFVYIYVLCVSLSVCLSVCLPCACMYMCMHMYVYEYWCCFGTIITKSKTLM